MTETRPARGAAEVEAALAGATTMVLHAQTGALALYERAGYSHEASGS